MPASDKPRKLPSNRDYENIYRLLGSFRGLSEAGIGYARLAEQVNWARWQEARF